MYNRDSGMDSRTREVPDSMISRNRILENFHQGCLPVIFHTLSTIELGNGNPGKLSSGIPLRIRKWTMLAGYAVAHDVGTFQIRRMRTPAI